MESNKKVTKENSANKLPRMVTSTIFFIVAFIVSNLYLQMLIDFFSNFFDYRTIFTYSHVVSLPEPTLTDIRSWNLSRVMVLYFLSPTICLVTGIILLLLIWRNNILTNRLRLFVFWLIICLVNIFLAQLLFGPFGLKGDSKDFYLTFAIVGTWMNISFVTMIFIAVAATFISIIWGVVMSHELTAFSYSSRFSASVKSRVVLTLQLYLVPLLLGSVPLLLLCREADLRPAAIVVFNLMLIGLGIFWRASTHKATANLRKQGVYLGSIEMTTRSSRGNDSKRGGERSLNKVPTLAAIACVILWLYVFIFLR